jgi:hypothetical protein
MSNQAVGTGTASATSSDVDRGLSMQALTGVLGPYEPPDPHRLPTPYKPPAPYEPPIPYELPSPYEPPRPYEPPQGNRTWNATGEFATGRESSGSTNSTTDPEIRVPGGYRDGESASCDHPASHPVLCRRSSPKPATLIPAAPDVDSWLRFPAGGDLARPRSGTGQCHGPLILWVPGGRFVSSGRCTAPIRSVQHGVGESVPSSTEHLRRLRTTKTLNSFCNSIMSQDGRGRLAQSSRFSIEIHAASVIS